VVLTELSGGVSETLEQTADGRIELAHSHGRAGEANFRLAGANPVLTGEKRRASSGATLLAVILEESDTLLGNPVDVGRFESHHAPVVGADVSEADIVTPYDKDVRFFVAAGGRP